MIRIDIAELDRNLIADSGSSGATERTDADSPPEVLARFLSDDMRP